MSIKIKSLYLLASDQLVLKLKTIESMNILKDKDLYEDYGNLRNKYKYYRFLGQDLLDAQIKTDIEIRPDYRYDVYVCKDQDVISVIKYKPALRASQIMNKCVPEFPRTEENRIPYDYEPISTCELYEPFKPFIEYTGYWYEIDINSAYPWALATMNKYPKLTKKINELYEIKKSTPKGSPEHECAKLTLNALYGYFLIPYGKGKLRLGNVKDKDRYWRYDHAYGVAAVQMIIDYMADVKKILEDAGAEVFSKTVDAFIFRAPKDFKIPETIKIGKELGEFKLECNREHGTILTYSLAGVSKISTVPSIPSRYNEPQTFEEYLLTLIYKNNNNEMKVNINEKCNEEYNEIYS